MLYVSLGTAVSQHASILPRIVQTFGVLMLACIPAFAAEGAATAPPATVCEVLAHPDDYSGKPVVVVGRFSFREYGRFISEKGCVLRVVLDGKNGPVPPDSFAVDNAAASRKLAAVRKTTPLATFRFGSSEYDRWAMIYGRVEPVQTAEKHGTHEFDDASGQILCHSQTLLIFLREQ